MPPVEPPRSADDNDECRISSYEVSSRSNEPNPWRTESSGITEKESHGAECERKGNEGGSKDDKQPQNHPQASESQEWNVTDVKGDLQFDYLKRDVTPEKEKLPDVDLEDKGSDAAQQGAAKKVKRMLPPCRQRSLRGYGLKIGKANFRTV